MEPLANRIATALKVLNPKGVALNQLAQMPVDMPKAANSDAGACDKSPDQATPDVK